MGWSIGFDNKWKRDIGYGVRAENPDEIAALQKSIPEGR